MHLKRTCSPTFWPIIRKQKTWAVRPASRGFMLNESMPLLLVIRDVLGETKTLRETKKLLNQGVVTVNGKDRTDYRFPVGLFDIIHITPIKKTYIVVPSKKGIGIKETKPASSALMKITNKVANGKDAYQYTFHNGMTINLNKSYKIGDSLVIGFDGKVQGSFEMKEGTYAVITGGRRRGAQGKITSITLPAFTGSKMVAIEGEGGSYITKYDYVFPCGKAKPEVDL
ncbi:MAG: hypothetical protein ABH829_01800 [archaeon]